MSYIGYICYTYVVLELWLRLSKGMFPVKYVCSTKPLFVSVNLSGDHMTATKMRQNLETLSFGDNFADLSISSCQPKCYFSTMEMSYKSCMHVT